jgi:hypothetical protein
MRQTNTATYRPVPPPEAEVAMDDVLAASFPASDPPAWNPGMARPIPVHMPRHHDDETRPGAARDETPAATPGAIDTSRSHRSDRTLLQAFVSLAGAAGTALLVSVAILLVGLPLALAVRGLLEILVWLFPAMR